MTEQRYILSKCPRCKILLIADRRYKTKTCPHCNSRIELGELKVMSLAKDSREARELLSRAKLEQVG